jgi:hypothetical protein
MSFASDIQAIDQALNKNRTTLADLANQPVSRDQIQSDLLEDLNRRCAEFERRTDERINAMIRPGKYQLDLLWDTRTREFDGDAFAYLNQAQIAAFIKERCGKLPSGGFSHTEREAKRAAINEEIRQLERQRADLILNARQVTREVQAL